MDTLSINQSDLPERNIQAARTDRFYKHADLVSVWLGSRDETSDLAIDLMINIKKYYDETDVPERIEGSLPFNDPAVWTSLNLTPFGSNERNAIGRFFSRTWHRRIWMVQEVVLAKAVVVLCGDRTLSWSTVWHFSEWLGEIGREKELVLEAAGIFTSGADFDGIECTRQLLDLTLTQDANASSPSLRYDKRRLFGQDFDEESPASQLAVLLLRTRGRWATDERDQVYALLGLLKGSTSLRPDYSKALADVFVGAANAIIDGTDNLGFMTLADQCSPKPSLKLPS